MGAMFTMAAGWLPVLGTETDVHVHPTWADFTATTWIAVVLIAIAAFWSIWKAVMYTLDPGETEPDHIKRMILEEPEMLDVQLSSEGGPAPSGTAEPRDA